ncbi:hypothetical protein [Candidatus Amarolinea dominans]|uniref:hypothetical protein n=1 Tax=Candidatus Amarolinea dominans TaxID=3140696 RepID=UPI0031346A7C|nr:hypothetical protein [Anaerolineae bacterium]
MEALSLLGYLAVAAAGLITIHRHWRTKDARPLLVGRILITAGSICAVIYFGLSWPVVNVIGHIALLVGLLWEITRGFISFALRMSPKDE